MQKLELKGIIKGAWGWAESAQCATLFLSVYLYSLI